jgi:hypothetical protein
MIIFHFRGANALTIIKVRFFFGVKMKAEALDVMLHQQIYKIFFAFWAFAALFWLLKS